MTSSRQGFLSGLAIAALATLTGCASIPPTRQGQVYDPYEVSNRKVLASNQSVLGPAATVVRTVIPGPVRDRLENLDANLKEPRIFANDVLQLRFKAAGTTLGRFVINSTIGVGGLFDVASLGGLPKQTGDFGQTLYRYGVGDGPYLVLPFIGPATTRDAFGRAVDEIADPTTLALDTQVGIAADIGIGALDFVTQVDQLKQAEDSSVDFYTFLRSSYYQNRQGELREALGLPPVVAPVDVAPSAPPPPVKHARICRHGKKGRC